MMQLDRMLVLGGAVVGLISIILGVTALATPNWINITTNSSSPVLVGVFNTTNQSYSLLTCTPTICFPLGVLSDTIKGLLIAGLATILLGVIAAVVLKLLIKNRWIQLLPQIFLIAGPTLILIGLILYVVAVALKLPGQTINISLEYSFILMLITCILGYITAVYFAFVAAIDPYHYDTPAYKTNVYQEPVRF